MYFVLDDLQKGGLVYCTQIVNCKFKLILMSNTECLRNHPSQRLMIKCLTIPDQIGICKCWFLRRGENRSIRRKLLRARKRTNNKLNPNMTPGPGIKPGTHWWEASALTTAPFLLPNQKKFNAYSGKESDCITVFLQLVNI